MLPASFLTKFGKQKGMTNREIEFLQQLVIGQQNQQIAHLMGTTLQVTKNYMKSIYRKLECNNRSQVIALVHVEFIGSSGFQEYLALKPEFEEWSMLRREKLAKKERDEHFHRVLGLQSTIQETF
jgi:DNA-binding CsgD family transcriptional regulator